MIKFQQIASWLKHDYPYAAAVLLEGLQGLFLYAGYVNHAKEEVSVCVIIRSPLCELVLPLRARS
jgi:hypothetical protein